MKPSAGIRELDRIARPHTGASEVEFLWPDETDAGATPGKSGMVESGPSGTNEGSLSPSGQPPDAQKSDAAPGA